MALVTATLSLVVLAQIADKPTAPEAAPPNAAPPAWVVHQVATTGQEAPIAGRTFDRFATAPLARDGVIAFAARLDDRSQVIITSGDSGLIVRAHAEERGETPLARLGEPCGLAGGEVWFAAADREGIIVAQRTRATGPVDILRTGSQLPGTDRIAQSVGYPLPAGDKTLVKIQGADGRHELVLIDDESTRGVLNNNDGLEGWQPKIKAFGAVRTDGDLIAFNIVSRTGDTAVCRAKGEGHVEWIEPDTVAEWLDDKVVNVGNPVPRNGSVHFTAASEKGNTFLVSWTDDAHASRLLTPSGGFTTVLGEPAVSDDLVAYIAWAPGPRQALRVVHADRHETVLEHGQDLDGRTIRRLKLDGLGADGQRVYFGIDFTDGSSGIFVAQPPSEASLE